MSSVFDFGAMGDGQSDDTDALQHAINDGGGSVVLPRGDYRITRPLIVDLAKVGRVAISGTGGLAKVIMAGVGPAFFLVGTHEGNADPLNFKPQIWQKERMPTIDGIEIEGAHPEADGIRIQGTMQSTLTRVAIRGVRTAVHVSRRARNILIDACHFFHNTGIGVHLDQVNLHQCIISDSHISYCRLGGIRIEGGEIRNLQITGNDIEYNTIRSHAAKFPAEVDAPLSTAEIYIDVQNGSVREGTISSNTIQATITKGGSNIRFIGAVEKDDQVGFWTISGNLIGNQDTNIHLTRAWGVVITGNQIYGAETRNVLIERSRNIVVSGNMLGHTSDFNPRVTATGVRFEDSHDCLVSGLQIQDAQADTKTGPPPVPKGRQALVELIRCQRLNVTGCQIFDGTPIGMLVEDCRETTINNCQIIDQRETPLMEKGLELRGALEHVIVSSCQIRRATQQAISGTPHEGLTLMNNVTT
ncbi:right-handed parallel beta-helix repeat-containing protein [Planctomicrobium piriforme]|uniref:Pectate lyase superfamily protein n=1 Tax=Planctomicrobium piriforme TaxID=1576369 RepID=A0A1I3K6P0_9PLAN|nr:right-handed parallel beta-helix repeat-containing protein [Planctomicrobium piriforme]SFI67988.1 Pectate lyase superfamily protein [Planctomicrobium piriforme]